MFKFAWLIVIGFLVFSSCSDYLDVKQDKSLVVLNTLDDLQALLDANRRMNQYVASIPIVSADNYFMTDERYNATSDVYRLNYTWQETTVGFVSEWSTAYLAIYTANFCLEEIAEIQRTQKNAKAWDNVKGSALFFRAFRFLNLVWDFSKAYDSIASNKDLGIVLRMTTDINVPSRRSNVGDCYDQIIKDCKTAAVYLPDFPRHVMRPSKVATYGLLARTYLSMRAYDSAYRYAALCLNLKGDLLDYNNSEIVDSSELVPFGPFNQEMLFSAEYGGIQYDQFFVDTALYKKYDEHDLRRNTFFYSARNGYHLFKGNYNSNNRALMFAGIATDEIYLIKAECETRMGMNKSALDDLNHLLSNRWESGFFVPVALEDPSQLLNRILLERRKELLFRGLRWMNIKRLNKENRNITIVRHIGGTTFRLPPNDNRCAVPIPPEVIKMTGMPQNPR